MRTACTIPLRHSVYSLSRTFHTNFPIQAQRSSMDTRGSRPQHAVQQWDGQGEWDDGPDVPAPQTHPQQRKINGVRMVMSPNPPSAGHVNPPSTGHVGRSTAYGTASSAAGRRRKAYPNPAMEGVSSAEVVRLNLCPLGAKRSAIDCPYHRLIRDGRAPFRLIPFPFSCPPPARARVGVWVSRNALSVVRVTQEVEAKRIAATDGVGRSDIKVLWFPQWVSYRLLA
jgi:hypothetical protein